MGTPNFFALSLIYGKSKLSELYPKIKSGHSPFTISTKRFIISFSLSRVSTYSKEELLVESTLSSPKLLARLIMIISSLSALGIPFGFLTSISKLMTFKSGIPSSTGSGFPSMLKIHKFSSVDEIPGPAF